MEKEIFLKKLRKRLFLLGGISTLFFSTPIVKETFFSSSSNSFVFFEREGSILQFVKFQIEGTSFYQVGYFFEKEQSLYFESVTEDLVLDLTFLSRNHLMNIYYTDVSNFSSNDALNGLSENQLEQLCSHTSLSDGMFIPLQSQKLFSTVDQVVKESDFYKEDVIRKVLLDTSKY